MVNIDIPSLDYFGLSAAQDGEHVEFFGHVARGTQGWTVRTVMDLLVEKGICIDEVKARDIAHALRRINSKSPTLFRESMMAETDSKGPLVLEALNAIHEKVRDDMEDPEKFDGLLKLYRKDHTVPTVENNQH